MCGIIGYVGSKNGIDVVIEGLKRLEYRGYDSAGICYLKSSKLFVQKKQGKVSDLEKLIKTGLSKSLVMGHTRWATHGKPTEKNAHPHLTDNVGLVHNGIIENYSELKESLKLKRVKFSSETDTEVITKLVEIELTEHGLSPEEAVKRTLKKFFSLSEPF